ncbi:MAG: Putative 8-amino-7-oxononanoate synthase, partial [Proteiniphilum sp. 51_7]
AVNPNDTLIRYSLMATHTYEQVDRSIESITTIFKKTGVL